MITLASKTSGVVASVMHGGRTTHSRFSLPLSPTETSLCEISKQSGQAELMHRARVIIWDEAPVAKRFSIETVDRSFMDIMNNSMPFLGKVVIFGGDFRQVLPLVPRATRQETVNTTLVKSYLSSKIEVLKLSMNMRAREDKEFGEFLLRVGNGDEPTSGDDIIKIHEHMVIATNSQEGNEEALIHAVFPSLRDNFMSAQYMTMRAILAMKNEYFDELNEKMIKVFPGKIMILNSFDEVVDDTNNYYQEEFLNTLLPCGLPPHKLELKVNFPIILLRNLDPSNGLCNVTRMVCTKFGRTVIRIKIMMGKHAGKRVLFPRIPLFPAEDEHYPLHLKRK